MLLVITTQGNEVKDVSKADDLEHAIAECVEAAEQNGFVPGILSKKRLSEQLRTVKSYDDGEMTVTIWDKPL